MLAPNVLVFVPSDKHRHAVAGTSVVLDLSPQRGAADTHSGVGTLMRCYEGGPVEHINATVFFDPATLDESRNIDGSGFYVLPASALYAVLLETGELQALGNWLLGEAVERPERKTKSGLILPSIGADCVDEEKGGAVLTDKLRGAMRVRSIGAEALPEFVGHEQRRAWAKQPVVYFAASQNGFDAADHRWMNGREWLVLRYPAVAGFTQEPEFEVVPNVFINDSAVRLRPLNGGSEVEVERHATA